MSSIINELELHSIPKDELIIRHGELGSEMYFIIKGEVNVISADGINLATIGIGENFGEMALLNENSVRSASI